MKTFFKTVLNETFASQKVSREYYFLRQNTTTKTKQKSIGVVLKGKGYGLNVLSMKTIWLVKLEKQFVI